MSTPLSVFASLWLLLCGLGIPACSWEPLARDVQPERLLQGPARVTRVLDPEGRFALAALGARDAPRYHIVDVEQRGSCELPADMLPVSDPLRAPNQRGAGKVAFVLPLLQVTAQNLEGEGDPPQLFYTDEKCMLRGPFGIASAPPEQLELRDDRRAVSIVYGLDGELRVVDPWTSMQRVITTNVAEYTPVQQLENSSAPQALWTLEGGKLNQRALDGSLLLSLGSNVSGFQQLLSDQLRVAYLDGETVFEAKGPGFVPVLIAEDACDAEYAGRALDLHTPCAKRQLVRIDLTTGEVKTFAPGVYKSYVQGEINFELQSDESGAAQVWVSRMNQRLQLMPTPSNAISPLDREHIAGRARDGTFGVWGTDGSYQIGFERVQQVNTFRDARTNQLLWLALRDVDDSGIGTLTLFDQRELSRIIDGMPVGEATTLSTQVRSGAYRVFNPGTLPEPVVLSLESPITVREDESVSGTLHARLLSGSMSTQIDVGVSSSEIVIAPLPGILYGIEDGPNSGLWFAAL
jgi:hypothetical protein